MNSTPQRPCNLDALNDYVGRVLGEHAVPIISIAPLNIDGQDGLNIEIQDARLYWVSPAYKLQSYLGTDIENPTPFEAALNAAAATIIGFYCGLVASRKAPNATISLDV